MNRDYILETIKREAKEKALENGVYTGNLIIEKLKEITDKNKPVVISMTSPLYNDEYDIVDYEYSLVTSDFKCNSWRGSFDLPAISYDTLSFNYESIDNSLNELNISVETIIKNIEESNGKVDYGYKGGEFILDMNDVIYIANYGESNDAIAIVGIEEFDTYILCYTKPDMY